MGNPYTTSSNKPLRSTQIAPKSYEEKCDRRHDIEFLFRAGCKPNAIPVEFPDLRQQLVRDFPKLFDRGVRASGVQDSRESLFRILADRIWLANLQRINRLFQRWEESYRFFNPDQNSVVHPKDTVSNAQFRTIDGKWRRVLYTVLEKAGFARIPGDTMEAAVANRALSGLNLRPPPPGSVQYEIFFRGSDTEETRFRGLHTWFRTRTVRHAVYSRLLVLYRIHTVPERAQEQEGCCGLRWPLLVRIGRMFSLGGESVTPITSADPKLWFLKIFKDVSSLDVDMIIPGASMDFTWLDVALIWVPTLFGLGSAIKTIYDVWGMQQTLLDYAILAVLFLMPLTWGWKAYQAIKNKENQYMVKLGQIYMSQNLNNNHGVCGDILDEAHEQENNEALLAYFFLWQGQDSPEFKEKASLDHEVESYLGGILEQYDQDPRVDFDVSDAVDKLVELGICTKMLSPSGKQFYRVCSLEKAAELTNPVRVSAFLNSLGTSTGRGPCAMANWRECVFADQNSGRLDRYFSNPYTGAHTREKPDTYVPFNFNSTGQLNPVMFGEGLRPPAALPVSTVPARRDGPPKG